ncbi:MAG: TIGR04133 family radical SAM/SPASM protein [Paludibacteraceae bacterium]|nr:TIGR04133 family radical SAM/SPASM protein [Paludibacteraceae bacterium]
MNLRLKIALELERLRRKNLQALHPLEQLFWESTLRCNVNCRHCGSDCLASVTQKDMPKDDFLKVIDEEITPHVDPHRVMIVISGGEPLMRTDLEEVGRALYDRGYPWGFVTNGLALTPERFRACRKAGLRSMSVSLDGTEEDHIWMRRHPKAFEGACRAISLAAAEKGFTWDVVTCVNRRNINHLDEIRDLLVRLGCRHWRLVTIDPMGRAKDDPDLLITDAEFTQLMDYIEANRPMASYSCEGFLGDREMKVRNHMYLCVAGVTTASILIDGSISACTSIRGKYYQGNIYKDHFWDIWENGFESYRNRKWMREKEPCDQCKMFRYCEGNGMHLRREDGSLMMCHYHKLVR